MHNMIEKSMLNITKRTGTAFWDSLVVKIVVKRDSSGYLLLPERFGLRCLIMCNTLAVLEVFSTLADFMEPFMMHVMKRKQLWETSSTVNGMRSRRY